MQLISKTSSTKLIPLCHVTKYSQVLEIRMCLSLGSHYFTYHAAAAAQSLQLCLTLCNPIDGSPPGSSVPGVLQARTLEWVAIFFSNAWNWKEKVKSLSRVPLFVTPWPAAYQAPPSIAIIYHTFSASSLFTFATAFNFDSSVILCGENLICSIYYPCSCISFLSDSSQILISGISCFHVWYQFRLFPTTWTSALQASLSITNSWSLLKLMSSESLMPSNHLILCHPLLLLPQSFPASGSFQKSQLFASDAQSIGVSASTSVLPVNTQDWSPLDGLVGSPCSPRDSQSLLQHHSSKASVLQCSAFFRVQLSHPYMTDGKTKRSSWPR